MLRRVVSLKFTDVSEVLAASIIRAQYPRRQSFHLYEAPHYAIFSIPLLLPLLVPNILLSTLSNILNSNV
jgi:hypothetical protein